MLYLKGQGLAHTFIEIEPITARKSVHLDLEFYFLNIEIPVEAFCESFEEYFMRFKEMGICEKHFSNHLT